MNVRVYKIYVDGIYVGTKSLTYEDVRRINNDSTITLKLD